MQKIDQTLKGFILGLLAALTLLVIIGAVDKQTQNIDGDTTTSFNSVYASRDGNVVYVCDNDTVYRSLDGGSNWSVVLKKNDNAGF